MVVKRFERVSMVDGAVAELQEEIRSGRWPVGTRIPPESQLVERLGMSRTPVREAVRSLVQSGLLVSRQGSGTFVVATDAAEVALRRRLEEADHDDVVQVRDGLDVVAARLAAANRSSRDLVALTDALERRRAAARAGRSGEFLGADTDFHVGIAQASGNPLLAELYTTMATVGDIAPHTMLAAGDIKSGDDDLHAQLLDAIADEDASRAIAAVNALLDHTRAETTA